MNNAKPCPARPTRWDIAALWSEAVRTADACGRVCVEVFADLLLKGYDAEIARVADAPKPETSEELYYVQNSGYCGNSLRWWRENGHGYTSNLREAWKVTKDQAESICRCRPNEDTPRSASAMDAIAELHVTADALRASV